MDPLIWIFIVILTTSVGWAIPWVLRSMDQAGRNGCIFLGVCIFVIWLLVGPATLIIATQFLSSQQQGQISSIAFGITATGCWELVCITISTLVLVITDDVKNSCRKSERTRRQHEPSESQFGEVLLYRRPTKEYGLQQEEEEARRWVNGVDCSRCGGRAKAGGFCPCCGRCYEKCATEHCPGCGTCHDCVRRQGREFCPHRYCGLCDNCTSAIDSLGCDNCYD